MRCCIMRVQGRLLAVLLLCAAMPVIVTSENVNAATTTATKTTATTTTTIKPTTTITTTIQPIKATTATKPIEQTTTTTTPTPIVTSTVKSSPSTEANEIQHETDDSVVALPTLEAAAAAAAAELPLAVNASEVDESDALARIYLAPLKRPSPHPLKVIAAGMPKKDSLRHATEEDLSAYGSFDQHPCRRVCQKGKNLSCYYRLAVHHYQRLGPECQRCAYDPAACESENCLYGDGVRTPVMAVNRQLPGPPIELCEGDAVVVDVLNYLTEATTIHWHGFHMSQTPDMDGAPYLTQYPLEPGEVYRYAFNVDRSGTLWYHSHMGFQRGLGVAGSLVVRQTREANLQAQLYDYDLIEHTLLLQDIVYNNDFTRPTNILINGKGRNHLTNWADNDARHRYERLRVSPGARYRMRVILNGIFNCPIEFSVENHKLLMISTDGADIEPIYADSFFMSSAERFDFVLTANQYASNYWVRVRGYGNCSQQNLYQGAVLHYRGATRNGYPADEMAASVFGRRANDGAGDKRVRVNYVSALPTRDGAAAGADRAETNVATAGLRALVPLPWPRYTKFRTYYSSFGTATLSNGRTVFQIDDITYVSPTVSLLQARYLYDENLLFCNGSSLRAAGRNCVREHCECTQVLRLPAYQPLELVVANYDDFTHPFHTHGYAYRLVGQAVLGSVADLRRIQELDRRGLLQRVPDDYPAVEKDTIQIPPRGYIIVRFISGNPGYWMYHCHIEEHALAGMVAVMKVGEIQEMKRIPPKVRC